MFNFDFKLNTYADFDLILKSIRISWIYNFMWFCN